MILKPIYSSQKGIISFFLNLSLSLSLHIYIIIDKSANEFQCGSLRLYFI